MSICQENSYSYNSGSCANCPSGSLFLSSSSVCAPSTEPTDTSFYLSGSQTEGVSAFETVTIPSDQPLAYSPNVYGTPNGAISIGSRTSISASGASLPSTMPSSGNVPWSLSSWVKCEVPSSSIWASVLEWGEKGDERGSLSTKTAALTVSGSGSGITVHTRTVGSSISQGSAIVVDSNANLYVIVNENIMKVTQSGTMSIAYTGFSFPRGLAIDSSNNLFVTEVNHIKKITPTGTITRIASKFESLMGIDLDSSGNIYVWDNTKVKKIDQDGTITTLYSNVNWYNGFAVDANGNVYTSVANGVKKISTGATITGFSSNRGIANDATGNIYVVDYDTKTIKMISSSGSVSQVTSISMTETPYGITIDSSGNLFLLDVTDSLSSRIWKVTLGGTIVVTLIFSTLFYPQGITMDSNGRVYVADTYSKSIKIITFDGSISTLASSGINSPIGITHDSSGNVFVTNAGYDTNGAKLTHSILKISPNGVVSTYISTSISDPSGIVIDSSNNIYVVNENNAILKITPSLQVSTVVSNLVYPYALAIDSRGNLYYSERNIAGAAVKRITPGGIISSLGFFVSVNAIFGLAVDALENVYVAIQVNVINGVDHAIKMITPGGLVTTIEDGFNQIYGVAVDASGNIAALDHGAHLVKFFIKNLHLPVCDSTWHHVSLSYTPTFPSRISAYIDGKLLLQHLASIFLPSSALSTLSIGWNSKTSINGGSFFDGSLSDLRIYNRALSVSEAELLAQPSAASFPGKYLTLHSSSPGGNIFRFECISGYQGPIAILARASSDNSFSWKTQPSCTSFTTSSITCASGGSRALPSSLNVRLLPAAHPSNQNDVDLVVAPSLTCRDLLNVQSCSGRSSVILDTIEYFVIGTAADLHMEAGEELICGT